MLNAEEKKLTQAQAALENIDVPELQLDEAIAAGINKGKRRRKKNLFFIRTFASAAVLVLAFTALLRTSETFASYVTAIPGMEKIVEFVRYDKGLTAAVENDFAKKIGVTDEHDGIKITLDSVIVDERMMVLFYQIESSGNHQDISIKDTWLTDEQGKGLGFSSSVWLGPVDFQQENLYQATYTFDSKLPPENMKMNIVLAKSKDGEVLNKLDGTWVLPFSVDRESFMGKKEIIDVNETVTVEGQKVTVEKVSIYPTQIGVTVKFDEANSKQIFRFEDLRLVDETGEEWAAIANGTIASHFNENRHEFYLQSNYFKKPKELYLRFNSLRALDKDEVEIIVDPGKMEVLKAPSDGRLLKVSREEDNLMLTFRNDSKDGHGNISLGQAFDQNGEEIGDGSASFRWSTDELPLEILVPYFGEGAAPGPITLKVNDYPATIKGEVKIRLK